MKSSCCIYLLPFSPIFNLEEMTNFESFNKEYSKQLYQALYFNNKEIINSIGEDVKIIYCLDQQDLEYIPQEFYKDGINVRFFDTKKSWGFIRNLLQMHTPKINNHFFLFAHTIGINSKEILRYVNLLFQEDNTLLLGKTDKDDISFFGCNVLQTDLFNNIPYNILSYKTMINYACESEIFLYILNKGMLIHKIEDFRLLYKFLSTKESESFCSQQMHELFTNIFIEYKELLK